MESRSEVPDENGHWTKTVFIQWYLPNGDSCELRKTSLCDRTNRLIERCFVDHAGKRTCTLKDVQEKGKLELDMDVKAGDYIFVPQSYFR